MKEDNKMKKVKVIDIFRDKYTNQVYKLNDILEVDEKRFNEIKVYVEEIIEEKNETKEDNLEEVNSKDEKQNKRVKKKIKIQRNSLNLEENLCKKKSNT